MPNASYRVLVDWDNDGDFTDGDPFFWTPTFPIDSYDVNENVSPYVQASPGIQTVRGRDQIRALAPPMAGSASCEVDNQDKRFSPEYTSGPLYGQLLPGRLMRIESLYDGITRNLFTGYLDDLPQHPARNRRSVSLPALGSFSKLANQTVSTALYQTITTDVALGHLLDAAGWPADKRVLDTGQTTLAWWWLDNEDAFAAARSLLATEGPGAALYEDGSGNVVFESRHYRLTTARSNTSQATLSDTGAEPLLSEPFTYNPGLKEIINVCEVTVKTRSAQSLAEVWALGSTLTFSPGQVRTVVASGSDPFTAAVSPVGGGTDYTVSTGSLTSVTLSRTSGASTVITLTAGASGATVTGLRLRAQSVTVTNTTLVQNAVDASASIVKFGRQAYTLATRAEIGLNDAQDFTDAVVGLYQDPRPTVQASLINASAERLTQSLSREISDRITVVEDQTGLSADFFIERIAHDVGAAGLIHRTTFGCEKAQATQYAVWGTATWGTGLWGY